MDPALMIPSYFAGYGPTARFRQRNNAIDAKKYDFRAQRTILTNPNKEDVCGEINVELIRYYCFTGTSYKYKYIFYITIYDLTGWMRGDYCCAMLIQFCRCNLTGWDVYGSKSESIPESIVHMLTCGLGSGLVVLHAAYSECGIWTALGLNVVLAAIVGYCVCILVWSAQKLYGRVQMATLTYPDIIEASILLSPWPKFRKCARFFRYNLEVILLIHLYGYCCVCVIMIGRNLKELVEGDDMIGASGDPPLKVYLMSLIVPCMAISMVTNLKVLAPFALICNFYALGLVLLTMWYGLRTNVKPWDRPAFKTPMGMFQFISICVFILEPVSYALPVENNMAKPKKFHYVILGTMPILTFAMVSIGFIGYWRYGENCLAPITIHFPYYPFPVLMKVFLCLILYVVYAMCFYVGFDIEWFYFKRLHAASNYWFWERLYRSFHVIAIVMVSYFFPYVTRMMGVLGAFSTVPIIFLYPPFIELIVDWEYPGLGRFKWRLIKDVALLIFGTIILFCGVFYNSYGLYLETYVYDRHFNMSVSRS